MHGTHNLTNKKKDSALSSEVVYGKFARSRYNKILYVRLLKNE